MSLDHLEPLTQTAPGNTRPKAGTSSANLPDPDSLPRRILHAAALRGLGYSFRTIGRSYGVTPQAVSVMLHRHRETLATRPSDLDGLSPRAVNSLGRLGIANRAAARAEQDLEKRLRALRNCGTKTIAEIRGWICGGFTLVELLVVIAIIAVLASIAVPILSSARAKAHTAETISHLRAIGAANLKHAAENNGLIAGEGNSQSQFPQSSGGSGSYGRLFPYISGHDRFANDWLELISFWTPLRDPAVPKNLAKDEVWPMTWAWNELFNMDWGPGRRLVQFNQPSKVLYVTTGLGEFTVSMASNPAQKDVPASRRDGFYFIHNGRCPAVFLDGHVELLSFPVDRRMVRPL